MGIELKDAAPAAHVADIIYHGDKLILPTGMSIEDAQKLLERRKKFLEEKVVMDETFDCFPWDGANAIDEVLTQKFGWAASTATPGFFGPTPPSLITIEVDYGKTKQVPWGSFSLPGVDGLLQTSYTHREGVIVFRLIANVKRKDEQTVRDIFARTRAHLKEHSIYRGKAIKVRFLDDDGNKLEMPEPRFMDVSKISEEMVIYSKSVQRQVDVNLFTPIRRVHDCMANDIPVKRGILLGGTFGTGKTLAATVASKIAVDSGITYLYIPRADELSHAIGFAKQNQSPACVVFCEDIDREMDGERTVEMDDILNVIDGIDTKNANIIVVLTTNNLHGINAAMLRPGRLDAVIEVTPPDAETVGRLLRYYGGTAINPATDVSRAAEQLKGEIPAVIAEVVKRAKLAQMATQAQGEKIAELGEEALFIAAESMSSQLKLLKDACNDTPPPVPDVEKALKKLFKDITAEIEEQA